ncbi:hypothetical protein [Chelativorans sp. AA-79]|uniref:hypothetical protein n=1 Tax=Chelativorans sp. AA-79 TaxID=3028735 RepID=UPI0023F95E46|nr:hypothetical protein [Chelativorans sp. AA-79]WEX10365.1 hypothetical protein PVE73_05250 [Chelativorans sp. AA-79]
MMNIRTATTAAGLASALMISGCVGGMPRSAESALEGQWMDAQGVGVSTFSNGQFATIASDTGNRLSQGTYRFRDGQTVEISMTSLIRQTQTNVTCSLAGPSQLNCTNAQGQNFVLTRRS